MKQPTESSWTKAALFGLSLAGTIDTGCAPALSDTAQAAQKNIAESKTRIANLEPPKTRTETASRKEMARILEPIFNFSTRFKDANAFASPIEKWSDPQYVIQTIGNKKYHPSGPEILAAATNILHAVQTDRKTPLLPQDKAALTRYAQLLKAVVENTTPNAFAHLSNLVMQIDEEVCAVNPDCGKK